MHHYRDSRGNEVDIVLEAPDGPVVGIEVKAAGTVRPRDLRGLGTLRDHLGNRFLSGLVLYIGQRAQAVAERILALPLDALWMINA